VFSFQFNLAEGKPKHEEKLSAILSDLKDIATCESKASSKAKIWNELCIEVPRTFLEGSPSKSPKIVKKPDQNEENEEAKDMVWIPMVKKLKKM
jgi:hypothetical protein